MTRWLTLALMLYLAAPAWAQCKGSGIAPQPAAVSVLIDSGTEIHISLVTSRAGFEDAWTFCLAVDTDTLKTGWDAPAPCATGHSYDWTLAENLFSSYPKCPCPTWAWTSDNGRLGDRAMTAIQPFTSGFALIVDITPTPIVAGMPWVLVIEQVISDRGGASLPIEERKPAWIYAGTL